MQEEPLLVDYWKVINKKKTFIISTTLGIVFLVLLISLIFPKTYESEAVIELGSIIMESESEGFLEELVYEPEEAKNILKSSTVIKPIIDKFYSSKDKITLERFNKKVMEVELITEKIDIRETRVTNFIRIRIRTNQAKKSKDITSAIIKEFFNYSTKLFLEQKDLIISEYNMTNKNIKKELSVRKINIVELKSEIYELEDEIKDLSSSLSSSDDLSEVTVLNTLLRGYFELLLEEKNMKVLLEQNLVDNQLDLKRMLTGMREFDIISHPQVPLNAASPKVLLNSLLALVLGFFFSVFVVLFKDTIHGNKE